MLCEQRDQAIDKARLRDQHIEIRMRDDRAEAARLGANELGKR